MYRRGVSVSGSLDGEVGKDCRALSSPLRLLAGNGGALGVRLKKASLEPDAIPAEDLTASNDKSGGRHFHVAFAGRPRETAA